MLSFLNFSFLDALDILLVAILLYYVYKLLKGSVAINIFIGIALIVVIWKITQALQMEMLSDLLGNLISVGAIAILIVFQPEVRKFLLMIGSANFGNRKGFFKRIFLKNEKQIKTDIKAIVETAKSFSFTKTGALLVIERTNSLDFIKKTGDVMNAEVNQPILESIFYKNSPLHDGAVIIKENTIIATRVILPLSKNNNLPSRFGLRHRAAIGVTEKTDAICITVSEETGIISYIKEGDFVMFNSTEDLINKIHEDLS